jgi:hypothetical protein
MNEKNHHSFPVIALFVLTLFVFLPATIYLTNSEEFANDYFDLFFVGVCLSLVFALVFWLIFLILRTIGPRILEKGLALLFGISILIWFQGNFLLWNYGPLDGRDIAWSSMKFQGFLDISIWIALLAAAFVFSSFVNRYAKRVSLILILMQLGYGSILLFKLPEKPSFQQYTVDTSNKFVFSKNKNVIIVILDSFPSDVFNEIILEKPNTAKAFDGFTFFRNSLSGYPATELSVALILTGKYYDNSLPFEQWKRDAYMSNSIPSVLISAGWQVDVFPKVSYSLYYSDKVASNFVKGVPVPERMLDVFEIYDLTLFRCLPHFFKPLVYNDQKWLLKKFGFEILGKRYKAKKIHSTRVSNSTNRKGPRNRHLFTRKALRFSPDVQFVNQMMLDSTTTDTKGTFKYYHFGVPHLPLLLDENMKYQRSKVNRQSYKAYATAGIKLMGIFLKHLQEIGVYDNSLVLIMGDHGAGGQQQEFIVQPGMPNDPEKHCVTERFRVSALPLILFKPASSRGKLKISDAPVSSGDVPATVFYDLGLSIKAPGIPMQSLDESAVRERRFLTYPGRDIFSYYGDMTEHIVSGYGWLDESWRASGRVFTRKGVVLLRH